MAVQLKWIARQKIRQEALEAAGNEKNGLKVYVARCFHEGEWMPGKALYSPGDIRAHVCLWGKEFRYEGFQVLVAPPGTTYWTSVKGRDIPENAVFAGLDPKTREKTYIGRGYVNDQLIVGKAFRNPCRVYIPYFGEHEVKSDFEVLVVNETALSAGVHTTPIEQ